MTRVDLEGALRLMAAQQHGAVSREQAGQLGCSDAFIRRRLRSPDWEPLTRRVMRLVGSTETFEQRCMVAVLDAGHEAVVCGEAAARIWGLPGFDSDDVEVTRQRRRARRPTATVPAHEPVTVPPHHRTTLGRVPVTTAARTVFDLMSAVRAGRAERALDNALARKLTTLRALRSIGEDLCKKGRSGSALFRRLLADRGVDFRPVESGLEAAFLDLLREALLPEPERQVDLGGDAWIGRVDFYFRATKLAVEIDSDRHHTAALDAASDRRRDEALRAAGFQTLRITEEELRGRPLAAAARLRAALRERAA
jgi:very-short-patch-repair endonuclease